MCCSCALPCFDFCLSTDSAQANLLKCFPATPSSPSGKRPARPGYADTGQSYTSSLLEDGQLSLNAALTDADKPQRTGYRVSGSIVECSTHPHTETSTDTPKCQQAPRRAFHTFPTHKSSPRAGSVHRRTRPADGNVTEVCRGSERNGTKQKKKRNQIHPLLYREL